MKRFPLPACKLLIAAYVIYTSLATCPSALAAFISIPADTQHDLVINATDNAGTTDQYDSNRDEDNLVNGGVIGNPLQQDLMAADSGNYWDSPSPLSGDSGMLIDLGAVYRLDAIQLYGYNITDGSIFFDRSLGSFSIWTATLAAAVTTGGGSLQVNDIGSFTQVGSTQSMSTVTEDPTFGESYLFGGAAQPADVAGNTHVVTADPTEARYLFLREMTSFGVADDAGIVGLGEIRVYGTPVPEPTSLLLFASALIGFAASRGREYQKSGDGRKRCGFGSFF